MRVRVASGIFGWEGGERRSDRYGAIHFTGSDFEKSTVVEVYLNTKVLSKSESYRRKGSSLIGKRVRLIGKVLETRKSGHIGDLAHGIYPSTPEKGEEIDLGVGTLDVENGYDGTPDIVLCPNDDRRVFWMDPRKLYRLHDQTIDLFAEETTDEFTPAPDIKPIGDIDISDTRDGDGSVQMKGAETGDTIKIRPHVESLGNGMFAISAPRPDKNGKFVAQKVNSSDVPAQLTEDEEKHFTLFNAAAFDLLRALNPNTHHPCWLCMSESARNDARENLRTALKNKAGHDLTMVAAEKLLGRMFTERQKTDTLCLWRLAESVAKQQREKGDPRSFFS